MLLLNPCSCMCELTRLVCEHRNMGVRKTVLCWTRGGVLSLFPSWDLDELKLRTHRGLSRFGLLGG
jgi:hypothetical protein